MTRSNETLLATLLLATGLLLSSCAPKVGSDEWCAAMKAKSKADWSANDAAAFAKHCILK